MRSTAEIIAPVIATALTVAREEEVISFDDVLKRLRRPWWRRTLDRARRLFRR